MTEIFLKKYTDFRKGIVDALFLILFWITGSFLSGFMGVPDCRINANINEEYAGDLGATSFSYCEFGADIRFMAIAWFVFTGLRVLFIGSKFQAGPLLHFSGLKITKTDGSKIGMLPAIFYVVMEWLPFHIMQLNFIILGVPKNLFALSSYIIFAFLLQVLWHMVQMRMGSFTGFEIVLTGKAHDKALKKYQNLVRLKLQNSLINMISGIALISCALFALLAVQIIRTPPLNPDYEKALYAGRDPVWERNLYIAMAGLSAPEGTKDTYQYGYNKILRRHLAFESAKKAQGISYLYSEARQNEKTYRPDKSREVKIKNENWKNLGCLFSLHSSDKNCATWTDYNLYISQNKILWDRFNALPEYKIYNVPPQFISGESWPWQFAGLKSAQIVKIAQEGHGQAAIGEWLKYMRIYRLIAASGDTLVSKAIITLTIDQHLQVLEKILYLQPQLAKEYSGEIENILTVREGKLFNERAYLADDAGMIEMSILTSLGNVNAVRNDYYTCVVNFEKRADLNAAEYFSAQTLELCPMARKRNYWGMLSYYAAQPGNIFTNMIQGLLFQGQLMGEGLGMNAKLTEVKFRMARLAVNVLKEDIKPERMAAYLASQPESLKNPLTGEAFGWDQKNQNLYFDTPQPGRPKTEFRLNLK